MSKPRLPWKRGPVAHKIAGEAEAVRTRLAAVVRPSLSLRQAAAVLGISTQPVREWIRFGYLRRDRRTRRINREELLRFLDWLAPRAEPFAPANYTQRLIRQTQRFPLPFQKLRRAQIHWPKGRKALSPPELAALVGCHPSLIVKAIRQRWSRLGRRRTPGRWEITRSAWSDTFWGTIVEQRRLPALPRVPFFSTRAVADLLAEWGMSPMSVKRVRQMIQSGALAAVPPGPESRRWQVSRKSLKKVRATFLTRQNT
jgi:excisionase family DNA binding protein